MIPGIYSDDFTLGMAESAAPVSESSPPFANGRPAALTIWVLLRIWAGIAAPMWALGFLWFGMHGDVLELVTLLFGVPSLLLFAFAPRSIWRHKAWYAAVMPIVGAAILLGLIALAKHAEAYGLSDLPPIVFRVVVLFSLSGLLSEAISWRRRQNSHA